MVVFSNYIIDLKSKIKNLLTDYKENRVSLTLHDANVINALNILIEKTTNFTMPLNPEDYNIYNHKKSINIYNFKVPMSFEYNFESYSQEYLINKKMELKLPFILFYIPKTEDNFNDLEFHTGTKIHGDLVFVIRKISNHWEFPVSALVVDDELKQIDSLNLFSNLFFQLNVEKGKENVNNHMKLNNKDIIKKLHNFMIIASNKSENIMASDSSLLIPTSFLSKPKDLKLDELNKRVELNSNLLYTYNLLYSGSIRC